MWRRPAWPPLEYVVRVCATRHKRLLPYSYRTLDLPPRLLPLPKHQVTQCRQRVNPVERRQMHVAHIHTTCRVRGVGFSGFDGSARVVGLLGYVRTSEFFGFDSSSIRMIALFRGLGLDFVDGECFNCRRCIGRWQIWSLQQRTATCFCVSV